MQRNSSQAAFDVQGASSSKAAMKNELDKLVKTCTDPHQKLLFQREMSDFYKLFCRYLDERGQDNLVNWDTIKSPDQNQVVSYDTLPAVPAEREASLLNRLAVIKLNGGLGTTMGCVGPKSAIEVRAGMTFLDLIVRQLDHLNSEHKTDVPLILMNSFNTADDTHRICAKYANHHLRIHPFNQSRYPRFSKDTLLPIPRDFDSDKSAWFPPGHGDLYLSMYREGIIDFLLHEGRDYVFVSNVDNLGATVDTRILQHMIDQKSEFIMEVTDKTRADVKGGTLVDVNGKIRLLEIAQVPPQHVEDFKSVTKFKIFNTNNLWIDLRAVKRLIESAAGLEMEIIVNPKTMPSGEKVIQLETAAGAAIRHFQGAHGINVPRSRFLPVKGTSDLFLVQSDLYSLRHGQLVMSNKRIFPSLPLIKLGNEFTKVNDFLSRFSSIPNITELDHLTVTGDVTFGKSVTLKGTVIIVANHGSRIDIPSGAVLENKVVSGNLRILDH